MSQKGFSAIIFILGVLLVSGLIVVGAFYLKNKILQQPSSNLSQKEMAYISDNETTKWSANNTNQNIMLIYKQQSYGVEKEGWGEEKYIVSDLNHSSVKYISKNQVPDFISPSTKYLARVVKKGIEVAKSSDFNYTKVIDDSDKVDDVAKSEFYTIVDDFFWSKEEDKVVYEARYQKMIDDGLETGDRKFYTEVQFFTADIDGGNKQMIAKIPDYTGGKLMGYDFDKQQILVTKNDAVAQTQTLIRLDVKDNRREELLTIPMYKMSITPDLTKVYYYQDKKTIAETDLITKENKILIAGDDPRIGFKADSLNFTLSPNGDYLIMGASDFSKKSKRFVFNLKDNSVMDVLDNPLFLDYSIGDIVYLGYEVNAFSPDQNYIMMTKYHKDINADKSGKTLDLVLGSTEICLVEVNSKKIIPFFNCNIENKADPAQQFGQDLTPLGWLMN